MAKIRKVEGKRSIMDIDLLLENPKNANEHPQSQIDDIIKSIKQLGFRGEIVIDENNTILAGHGRTIASKQMGLKKLPVVKYTDLTEAEKISYMNLDNRLQAGSTLNIEKLQQNFIDIELLGGNISDLEKDLFDFAIPDIQIGEINIDPGNKGGSTEMDNDIDPNINGASKHTAIKEEDTEEIEGNFTEKQELDIKKDQVRAIQIPVKDEIYDETFEIYRELLDKGVDIGEILLKAMVDRKKHGEN